MKDRILRQAWGQADRDIRQMTWRLSAKYVNLLALPIRAESAFRTAQRTTLCQVKYLLKVKYSTT